MFRTTIAAALACVVAGVPIACKKDSPRRPESPESQASASAPAVAPAAPASAPSGAGKTRGAREARRRQLPVFVEVVLEVAPEPPSHEVIIDPEPRGLPQGYVHRAIGPNVPGRLYPAAGKPHADTDRQRLWVGTRFRNHLEDQPDDRLTLRSSERTDFTLVSRRAKSGSNPWLKVYPGSLSIAALGDGDVTVRLGDAEARLAPGGLKELSSRRVEIDRSRWADAIVAEAKAPGAAAGGRKEVLATLARRFPGKGAIVLFTRTTVIHRGSVKVSAFDVQHQWQLAQRAAAEGPYEHAEEALERVLEAAPAYRPAVDLLVEVTALLDAGVSPALLMGKLAFPAGAPTAKHKALWKRHHPGFVTLTAKGEAQRKATYSAPIADGAFRIAAPQGEYRLAVMVPGFKPARRDVTLRDEKSITVRMSP